MSSIIIQGPRQIQTLIKLCQVITIAKMEDGSFSDGSGCGNETASERLMMRKFMIDSVTYWATEYTMLTDSALI